MFEEIDMTKLPLFISIFLFIFIALIGCEFQDDDERKYDCLEKFVYNSRLEMCVRDDCDSENLPENGYCEMGCLVIETPDFINIDCHFK